MQSNPQLVYVSSLFTSKIFWTQVLAGAGMLATALGLHPAWLSADNQAELVGTLTMVATVAFRLFAASGPVSVTAPLSTPANQELGVGEHTITVAPPPPPVAPPAAVSVVSRALPVPPLPAPPPPPVIQPAPPAQAPVI